MSVELFSPEGVSSSLSYIWNELINTSVPTPVFVATAAALAAGMVAAYCAGIISGGNRVDARARSSFQ